MIPIFLYIVLIINFYNFERIIKTINKHFTPLLSFSTALFLLRSNIPYAIYIFSVLQGLLLLSLVFENSLSWSFISIKKSVKSVYSYYLISLLFIIGLFLSPYTVQTQGDSINLIILLSFFILFLIKINTIKRFYVYRDYFLKYFILLFSLYLLIRFSTLVYEGEISKFFFIFNNSEDFDRNSYALNLWITIISIFFLIRNKTLNKGIIPLNIYISFLLTLVLFSSSRRGIIILAVFSIGFILWQLYTIFKQKLIITIFSSLFFIYLGLIILVFSTIIMPAHARNIIFNNTIKEKSTKSTITQTIRRYYIIVFPNTTYKEFDKILWGEHQKNNGSSIVSLINTSKLTNTEIIDIIQTEWNRNKNKDSLLYLLPNINKEQRLLIKNNNIDFLAEITKLPYTYNEFFSCVNIKNFELKDLRNITEDFPYKFSFNKDTAYIHLKLPALSNSKYELSFRINCEKKPIIIINTEPEQYSKEDIKNKNDNYIYKYKFKIKDNKNDILDISLKFINNVDSFEFSDIKWRLVETNNTESPDEIISKLKHKLKKFKFEQNRSGYLWNYYFKAEELTDPSNYVIRNDDEVYSIINNIYNYIKIYRYTESRVINGLKDSVLLYNNAHFASMRFPIPAIQNSILQFDMDYYLSDTIRNLSLYLSRSPQIINVFFRAKVLSDSINEYKANYYKRRIKIRIDSNNSATINFVLGIRNNKDSQLVVVNNYSFHISRINDTTYLSDAQYNYIYKWNKRLLKNNLNNAQKDSFNLLVNQEKQQLYWNIDTNIYQYAMSDRLELWLFGWQYFKALPWYRQVFGDGFNYYKVYKLRFGSKYNYTKEYFPHNPILSALLYSGIIGAIAYIFFLLQVFYYYYKYRKDLVILVLMFILVFLFSFVSNRSHFTDTYLIIFTIFPFILHNIYSSKRMAEVGE